MVFYFTVRSSHPEGHVVYMGRDKHENEHLIAFGLPEDWWFHVDKLSSAHVYLRLKRGESIEDVGEEEGGVWRTGPVCPKVRLREEICEYIGCKLNEVVIVYTPWSNLKKTSDMETGSIGFHDRKLVRRMKINKKNESANRLEKTKVEKEDVDFRGQREDYDKMIREEKKEADRIRRNEEKEERLRKEKEKEERSYLKVWADSEKMQSNTALAEEYETAQDYEDDFM